MEAGDDALADRAIVTLDAARAAPPDAILFSYARAVRAGDKAAAASILTRIGTGPFDFVTGLLGAWAAYDAGGDPLAKLGEGKANPVARRYTAENRALLLIATGRIDEGAVALQALAGRRSGKPRPADQRRGAVRGQGPAGHRQSAAERQRKRGGGVAPDDRGRRAAIERVRRVAAVRAARRRSVGGEPTPIVISLARAALRLDPGNDRARILLAQALARGGASDRALSLLGQVDAESPFHETALQARVAVLSGAGEGAGALAAATTLSNRKDATSIDAVRVGDLLTTAGRFDEAARAYGLAIKRAGDRPPWTLFLQLGGALDQAGRWPEARKALERAVEMAPEEAVALNYLGYARLEHGEDPAASIALLEKANALQPGDASIIDLAGLGLFPARRDAQGAADA